MWEESQSDPAWQAGTLLHGAAPLLRGQKFKQVIEIDRLTQLVYSSPAGREGDALRVGGGEQDGFEPRLAPLEAFDQFRAIHSGEIQVHDSNIRQMTVVYFCQRVFGGRNSSGRIAAHCH